jgi:sporulation protein YlmC with PRC-barrel domain
MEETTMKKHLVLALVSTALTSGLAFAQQGNAPANTNTQASARSNEDRSMILKQGQWRGSKLIGLTVYNNKDERVGDINELITGKEGKIESVVIGVGGFLGLGEYNVSVPFGQVKFVEEPRRTDRIAGRNEDRGSNAASQARNDAATRLGANPDPHRSTAANVPPNTPAAANRTPDTTASTSRSAVADSYRGYPDHAVINMSKDQLKSLPPVRYSR